MSRIKGILGKLFAGPLLDLIEKLSGEEGMEWLAALEKFLRKENPWEEIVKKVKSDLLKWLPPVTVSATSEKFVVKEKIKVDTSKEAELLISFVGDNFQNWFGDKVEEPIAETVLNPTVLKKKATNQEIIKEFGGENMVETTITAIYALMTEQSREQRGVLFTNGYANIFYVRDVSGVLRAVYVDWYGDGWGVVAYVVSDPDRWYGGDQVFSRNS